MNPRVFVFAFQRPDERWGVVNDPQRRLIATRYCAVAERFAAAVEARAGLSIVPTLQGPMEIAELVMSAHVAADDIGAHVVFIENGLTDLTDVLFRAAEMAEAVPMDTPGDWWAANTPRATTA